MKYDLIIIKESSNVPVALIDSNLNHFQASSSAVKHNRGKRCDPNFKCIFVQTGSWAFGQTGSWGNGN